MWGSHYCDFTDEQTEAQEELSALFKSPANCGRTWT